MYCHRTLTVAIHNQAKMMEWTGKRIRVLRKRLDLTQQELAERLGYKRRGTVSDLEHGRINPNPQTQKLLDMLEQQAKNGSER